MFHIAARESLCDIVLDSNIDSATKKRLIDFIVKEATDYQVMSLLVDEQLPLNESDFEHEIQTYTMFHAIVESNREFLEEWMGADFVDSLKKVRPTKKRIGQMIQEKELSAAAQRQQAGAADRYMNYLKQVYVRNPAEYKQMQPRVWAKLPADKKKEFSTWAKEKAPEMRKQVVAQQQQGGPQVRMGPPQRPDQQQQAQPQDQQQVQQTQAQQQQPEAGGRVGDVAKSAASGALAVDRSVRTAKRLKDTGEKGVELAKQGAEKGKEVLGKAGEEIGKTKEKLKDVDVKQTAQDVQQTVQQKAGEVAGTVKQKAQDVATQAQPTIQKAKETGQDVLQKATEKGKDILYGKKVTPNDPSVMSPSQVGQRKGGLVQKGQQLKRDIQQSDTYKKGEEVAKQATAKAKEVGQKVFGKKLVKPGTGEVSRSGGLAQKVQQAAQPAVSAAKSAALQTGGAFKAAAAKGGVTAGLKAAALTPGGLAVSGAMLGGLVGFGAWKMYQRFLSAAARNCRGYSGRQKTMCMNKYKVDGLNRQIVELQRGFQACERTKNQIKCKNSINKKIQRVRQKIAKIQGGGPPNQAQGF
jgi:hypothetical protein